MENRTEILRRVAFLTLANGLWLGIVAWLVLGVWLDVMGFLPCWILATLMAWIIAMSRRHRVKEIQGVSFEEMPQE